MTRRAKFIMIFWVIFVLLFIVSHKFLANIIIQYQQRPFIETNEAYQIITRYQEPVLAFYRRYGRCPTMADKSKIITEAKAYHYVKTIRLLTDQTTNICFITAVMRKDTPSKAVKSRLITVSYNQQQSKVDGWQCYTNINSPYIIKVCREEPLPENFLQVLNEYTMSIEE